MIIKIVIPEHTSNVGPMIKKAVQYRTDNKIFMEMFDYVGAMIVVVDANLVALMMMVPYYANQCGQVGSYMTCRALCCSICFPRTHMDFSTQCHEYLLCC